MELFTDLHSGCEADSRQPLTLRNGRPLGAIRTATAEIRAFGPEGFPLGEAGQFGVKGAALNGWVPLFAAPEVWLEMKSGCSEGECKLNLKWIGLEQRVAFTFYVKAPSCQIGNEIFKPKSLRRFQGEISSALFAKLKIESERPRKAEVIPLAGEGGFWDAEFLLAFEIHPLEPQASFSIKTI